MNFLSSLFACHLRAIQLLLVGASIVALSSAVGAEPIRWHSNASKAVAEAAQTGKPLLIKVSTEWCHYCKKMESETFSQAAVSDQVNACFVALRVDGDRDKEMVRKLAVKSYPTTVVFSPQMQHLTTIKGFRSSTQLRQVLGEICPAPSTVAATRPRPQESVRAKMSVFGLNCPVSPMQVGRFVPGLAEYSRQYRGFQLQFANAESMQLFQENPNQYWPAADGLCVVSAVEENATRQGQLRYGLVFENRVWLFSNQQRMERFRQQPQKYAGQLQDRQGTYRNATRRQTQRSRNGAI